AALPLFEKAVGFLDKAFARTPRQPQAETFLGNALVGRAMTFRNLGRHGESVSDWDRAGKLGSKPHRLYCRTQGCVALARAGDHVQAFAAANAVAEENQPDGTVYGDLARACAIAAAKTQDTDQREKYAARAVELLKIAIDKGYNDKNFLTSDRELAPLRDRD